MPPAPIRSLPIWVKFNFRTAPVASTGYQGLAPEEKEFYHGLKALDCTLQFWRARGYEYVTWNGKRPRPIVVEGTGEIIALLAGQAPELTKESLLRLSELLNTLRGRLEDHFGAKERRQESVNSGVPSRGEFVYLQDGMSMGGGRTEPSMFTNASDSVVKEVLRELAQDPDIKEIATFMSESFGSWQPRVYALYNSTMSSLERKYPSLSRPILTSIFAAITYNFGPQTVCNPHLDGGNLPFGWCAVTAVGPFNPTKGGHLILHELKLIIEFPPGSTILLPSAIITHSNVPISEGEKRYSITQYTAGGLFRWVDYGFVKAETFFKDYKAKETAAYHKAAGYWEKGVGRLTKWDRSASSPMFD